jgi:hypothetical protein
VNLTARKENADVKRFLALLLLITALPTRAGTYNSAPPIVQDKFNCRISVRVSADDIIKSRISSLVQRELRTLGDVSIVDYGAEMEVSIVALVSALKSGRETGYAFSIVVSDLFPEKFAEMIIKTDLGRDDRDGILDYLKRQKEILHHSLLTGSDLEQMCKRTAAEVDAEVVESKRKDWQALQDLKKKPTKPRP